MASSLDLIGVVSPICLLKCKSALSRLNPGEVLEVVVQDQEVVESLSMILKQSQDTMESFAQEGDCFRISIRKGDRVHSERCLSGKKPTIKLQ